jgi:hypothetical protein
MRRLLTISAALLVTMALALPSQAGPKPRDKHVSNDQMTSYTLQASWSLWDEEAGMQRDGSMNVYEMEAGTFAEYWDSFWHADLCDEGDPTTPEDDVWGDYGYEMGTGEWQAASLEILGRYEEGYASAVVTLYGSEWNSCEEYYNDQVTWEVEVDLHLLGTTPVLREKDSYSVTIPSLYNEHQTSTFRGRYAEGTLTIDWGEDSETITITDGRIGLMQFKGHTNS